MVIQFNTPSEFPDLTKSEQRELKEQTAKSRLAIFSTGCCSLRFYLPHLFYIRFTPSQGLESQALKLRVFESILEDELQTKPRLAKELGLTAQTLERGETWKVL